MKSLDLTDAEIDVILDMIDDQLDNIYGDGPENLSEFLNIEIRIMNDLKKKLEKLL